MLPVHREAQGAARMRGHKDSSWRGEERLPSERRHGGEDLAPSRDDVVRNDLAVALGGSEGGPPLE